MAIKKARSKAGTVRKGTAKIKAAASKVAGLDIGQYIDDLRIGNYSWDDVLKNSSKNMDALAQANRAIIEGYTDIARRQYRMLKDLLRELRKVRGDRDEVVKELKRVIARAKQDAQALQKIASRTNSKAQRIVKKRAEANIKAWKTLVAEAKKSVTGKFPAGAVPGARPPAAKKKVAAKRKPSAKRKAAPARKAAARRKTAPRRKTAAKRPGRRT
jgi:hypothetical protein